MIRTTGEPGAGTVKAGLSKFVANIGEHLKKGLLDWLLGALSSAGIELPENFDLEGPSQPGPVSSLARAPLGQHPGPVGGRRWVSRPMAKMEQAVDVAR